MTRVRNLLKTACWLMLVVGWSFGLYEFCVPNFTENPEYFWSNIASFLPHVAFDLIFSTLAAGTLRLVISIDERLEQLVAHNGGK